MSAVATDDQWTVSPAHRRTHLQVVDRETGAVLTLDDYMAGVDYGDAVELKRVARELEDLEQGHRYACPWCDEPMGLRSLRIKVKHEQRFHFQHKRQNNPCTGSDGKSEAQICAMKFGHSKEGARHKQIKQWVLESLSYDPTFSDVAAEQRWVSAAGAEWRQPDVQACRNDERIAFEVQLSTTFLHVIAERMTFYRGEGGRLLWLFGDLDPGEFRMAEDDLFYSNNRNAFRVSPESVAASREHGRFALECTWHEPTEGGDALVRRMVFFDELTTDVSPAGAPRAYFFDYTRAREAFDQAQKRAQAEAKDQTLRGAMEAHMVAFRLSAEDDQGWGALRQRFGLRGFDLPERLYGKAGPFYLLQAAYSAKLGEPVASEHDNLMGVANTLFQRHQPTLWVFTVLLGHYGRAGEFSNRRNIAKWKKKRDTYRQAWLDRDPDYKPDRRYDDLLAFLFPEVADLLRASPSDPATQHRARQGKSNSS